MVHVSSKLDLRSTYHQIKLASFSKYVTVFATHKGLFKYCPLFFGIKSTSEIFGHTLQSKLNSTDRVKSIADDIFIFGKDQASHDKALEEVLQRLRDRGFTLNKDKCAFNKSNLDFFGLCVFETRNVS